MAHNLSRIALRARFKQELLYLLVGAAALAALIFLLPLADTSQPDRPTQIAAYAFVIVPVVALLHGSLLAARGYVTSRLLAFGVATAVFGVSFALLARPEDLENSSGFLLSLALLLANLFRILAATCVGILLARYIRSVGIVLLVVAVAAASDLFSVFAGPTKVLLEEDSPVLDLLLLVFPTFGSALGFGLGVSDFVFLALFAAASRFLNLRYLPTLLGVCLATFLALTAGLLLERSLPALPFVAIAFVLVNVDLILAFLKKRS